MPGDPRPLSDRNSCTVANGGASVPEVLGPAKLEGIFAVVVSPMSLNQGTVLWAIMKRRRRNSPCILPEVDMTQGRKA